MYYVNRTLPQALARVRSEGEGRGPDRGRAEARVRTADPPGDRQAERPPHPEHQAQLDRGDHRTAGTGTGQHSGTEIDSFLPTTPRLDHLFIRF